MAYIAKKARDVIDISPIGKCRLISSKELSYAVIQLVHQYAGTDEIKLNEALGTLESVKGELFRKHINPAAAQHEFDLGD
jgi:hypothetical protein